MANIKGITIEIGGNTTKLVAALRDVDKQVKGTQTELKEVDKLLKLDPGNTELLTQKQKLLADAIQGTKEKLEKEKIALEQLKNADQNETTKKQQENLKREIEKTTQELKKLEGQYKEFGSVAGKQLQVAGSKMQAAGKAITGVGYSFAPVSTAATAATVGIAKTAMDFESQMSKVKAISGATGEDFEKLKVKAREMGAKTAFSATEAGQAFEYMAMAGWKTEEMLNGIEGIMNLAAASGESLGSTSDIVTDALSAFGMKAKDSGRFADILTAAANNANTNVSMLGESFKYIASTAGAFNYSAEDVAIALGIMANAGIKGSQAGTTLNAALVNLIKPSEEQATAMAKLGLITTDTIKKIDFSKVEKASNKVKAATLNVNTAQAKYDEVLKKFPVSSSQAIAAHNKLEKAKLSLKNAEIDLRKAEQGKTETILGQNKLMADASGKTLNFRSVMDTLRATLGQTNIEIFDAEGNIKDYDGVMASAEKSGLNLTQMQVLQNAAIVFGKRSLPGMLALINASEEDYQKLAKAIDNSTYTLSNMNDRLLDSGIAWEKYTNIDDIKTYQDFIDKITSTIKTGIEEAGGDADKLNAVLQRVMKEYGLTAEDAQLVMKTVQESMSGTQGAASKTAETMLDNFKGRLTILKSTMQELALQLSEHLMPVLEDVVAYIKSWVEWFQNLDDSTKKTIVEVLLAFAALSPVLIIIGKVVTAIGSITTALGGLLTFVKSKVITEAVKAHLLGLKTYVTTTIFPAIKTAVSQFITYITSTVIPAISTAISGLCTWITSTALPAIGNFILAWGPYIAIIAAVAAAIYVIYDNWDLICKKCKELWDAFINWLADAGKNLAQFFSDLWNVICGVFGLAWDWISEIVKEKWKAFIEWFADVGKNLAQFFEDLWHIISGIFEVVWDWIGPIVKEAWNGIVDWFVEAGKNLSQFFSDLWDVICELFGIAWDWIADKIKSAWNGIAEWFAEAGENLSQFFSDLWDVICELFGIAWDWIADKIKSAWNGIVEWFVEAGKSFVQFFSNLWDSICDGVKSAWDWIAETIKDAWNGIVNWFIEAGKSFVLFFKNLWDSICSGVKNAWDWIADKIKGAWNGIVEWFVEAGKSFVDFFANLGESIWEAIKSAFSKVIDYVKGVINWIKEAMGFSVKTPKVDTSDSGTNSNTRALQNTAPAPVSWYKKAMDDAYILNSPTIFGMSGGRFLGGGEAGSEAIVGTAKLAGMIKDAVSSAINGGTTVIPVYIGQERIEEIVVRANNIANYRSGGR